MIKMKEYEILVECYDLLSNSRKTCFDFFTPEEGKDVYKSLYAQVCWKYGDSAEILNYEEFE